MSRRGKSSAALLASGLVVALGAAAATAHGLFEVAAASGVPAGIAWIYPLITDGLAIVAYAATSRLDDAGRRYAWAVVILAAGLSGVEQAVFLAGGIGTSGAGAQPAPEVLRLGVGAWPAIAAAIVAHLLFMLATDHRPNQTAAPGDGAADRVRGGSVTVEPAPPSTPAVAPERVQRPVVQPRPVQSSRVQSGALDASAPLEAAERTAELPALVQPEGSANSSAHAEAPRRPVSAPASPKRDRALREARKHLARVGGLPTVDQLMQLADVSRGTAGTALQELREQPAPLHLITETGAAQTSVDTGG